MAWAIFVDFDGTITDRDTFDVLVEHVAGRDAWDALESELDRGTMTIRDALAREAALVRGTYDDVTAFLRAAVRVDPHVAPFVAACRARGYEVTVVSSGIEPIIRERLRDAGVTDVAIVANGLDPDPAGWRIVFRDPLADNGTDKAALVRDAASRGLRTAFIGDGRSDFDAAEIATRRFAKRGYPLERRLRERGVPFTLFATFAELTERIAALESECDAPVG